LCAFSDGTWQNLSNEMPTNVVILMQALKLTADDGKAQIALYDEGIGGDADRSVDKTIYGAVGGGIVRNIKELYRQIALNFEHGDEVYLFGFSRGAFTVRSLANFMWDTGLVPRQRVDLIDEAYELYQQDFRADSKEAIQFRRQFGVIQVPVRLVACFDTVASLGLPKGVPFSKRFARIFEHHDYTLTPSVDFGIHACSVDEDRGSFALVEMDAAHDHQHVWCNYFPGGHGAVGGGTVEQAPLSNIALKWMVQVIHDEPRIGVEFDLSRVPYDLKEDPCIDFPSSETRFGRIIRKVGGSEARPIADPENIHPSVIARWKGRKDYRPKTLALYMRELSLNA